MGRRHHHLIPQYVVGTLDYAYDCLTKFADESDDGECICEECDECGKMPAQCTGTPCSRSCQCNDCQYCHARMAMKAIHETLLRTVGRRAI